MIACNLIYEDIAISVLPRKLVLISVALIVFAYRNFA